MFCSKCGNQCREGARFCPKCGAELLTAAAVTGTDTAADTDGGRMDSDRKAEDTILPKNDRREMEEVSPDSGSEPPKKKKGLLAVVIVVILAAAVAAAAFFFLKDGGSENQYEKHMEAGRSYLEEEAYEEAVDEFEEAIAIDDMVVEPYQLMAQAYIGLEDDEKADETYDTVRGLIVTAYEESDGQVLLEDAKETYVEAINYYGEQGDTETLEEVTDEIIEMLPDEEEIAEVTAAASQYLIDDEEDAEDVDADETAETQESEKEWYQLYADYLETADIEEEEYYFLIYLNDDDIPELLFNGTYNAAGSTLYYIQDGQVKEESLINIEPYFAERGGYIGASVIRMGTSHDQILYLTDEGELITVFDGSYTYPEEEEEAVYISIEYADVYSDVIVNDEEVSVSEFLELYGEASKWILDGTSTLVVVGIDGKAYLMSDNWSIYDAYEAYDLDSILNYLRNY